MKASESIQKRQALNIRALPSLEDIRRRIDRVIQRWPDAVRVPEERDRERLAQEMLKRVYDWDWSDVKSSRITSAAIAVFDGERCDRPDLEKVRDFYYDEIRAREAGSFLDAMLWVYVESFSPGAPHTLALARALSVRKSAFGTRIQALIEALPSLFDPDRAPSRLGEIMAGAEDPYAHLKAIGFRSPHAAGLSQHAHHVFVREIAPRLRDEDERKRLFRWLMPKNGSALQNGAVPAVEALLAVWRGETPPDHVRSEISEAIISAYNDPRLHHGGIWASFDPDLKQVFLRWLTKQDMKFFCDMVTATQDSHMWPPRRDFWLRLYDDGLIDEAWVAFGSTARQYAQRHLFQSGESNFNRRFGRQLDRGGSTSLLIMRIGNKIVVDGCHSYQTHIFRLDDRSAPVLYQSTYHCDQILHRSTKSKTHWPIPNWERWVMQNV
ncbi:MAG: EH signature domain-containing protein [Zhengella sp.]|uniref:EH signature domain-containing protein n=1 Tax=Zhengella sp. TaxID=2282762 RepID=UPI003528AFF8